jgi:hypothetical protein
LELYCGGQRILTLFSGLEFFAVWPTKTVGLMGSGNFSPVSASGVDVESVANSFWSGNSPCIEVAFLLSVEHLNLNYENTRH